MTELCHECYRHLDDHEHEICDSCVAHFSTWERDESDYIDDRRDR